MVTIAGISVFHAYWGSTLEREQVAVRALEQWVTGRGDAGSRQYFIENGAHFEAVASGMGPADVAFVPAGIDLSASQGRTISYDGALSAPGDQFFIENQIVEVQEYLASGFVEVLGPTVVHLGGDDGWSALVEDAEAASLVGIFPEHLLNPGILLGDRNPLLNLAAGTLHSRFHVWADGSVTFGTQGKRLGSVATSDLVGTPLIDAVNAISGAVSPGLLAADAGRFPIVARYIGALDLLRALKVSPAEFPLVGFGLSLIEDDRADATPPGFEPLLGRKGDDYLLINPTTRARHRLSRDTAVLVEVIQTSSTRELAAERASKCFGLTDAQVSGAFEQIERNLRVRTSDADVAGIVQ